MAMKKFVVRLVLLIVVPILVVLGIYVVTDPFRILKPFSLHYFDTTNRDYLSSELFIRNYPKYHYDSYVFGSSKCYCINTYHWLKYLPENSRQYMFQAWSETLTGIEQKISYIDEHGLDLNNVLILIDIPDTFSDDQLPTKAKSIKDFRISGQPELSYQATQFWNYLQKPSFWYKSVIREMKGTKPKIHFDTISNDWFGFLARVNLDVKPPIDSLSRCSETVRETFLNEIATKTDADLQESQKLIDDSFERQLLHIKAIFDKHGTDYEIVITPAYCYTHPCINRQDLKLLQDIFGEERIFDYSGKNELTTNCYNFFDPLHFDFSVGWRIIEDIYNR